VLSHLLQSMSLHPLSARVQIDACSALRNLAMSEMAERRAVSMHALDLVFLALHNHPTDIGVQKEASCVFIPFFVPRLFVWIWMLVAILFEVLVILFLNFSLFILPVPAVSALHNLVCDRFSHVAIARDRLFGLRAITLLFHRHRDSPAILSKLCRLLRNLAHPQIAMASNVPSLLSGSSSGDSHSSYMGRTEANLSDELPDEASIGPILESLQRRLVVGDPPDFYFLPSMPVKPVEGPQWLAFTIPEQESSAREDGDVAALNSCSGTPLDCAASGGALLRALCLTLFVHLYCLFCNAGFLFKISCFLACLFLFFCNYSDACH
jgi:hypothetical protein